jgi:hypothetical protein
MTSLAEVYFGWSSSGQARDARFYAGIEDPIARDQQASLQGLLRYEGRPGGRPFARFRNFAVGRNLAPRESLYFRAPSVAPQLLIALS